MCCEIATRRAFDDFYIMIYKRDMAARTSPRSLFSDSFSLRWASIGAVRVRDGIRLGKNRLVSHRDYYATLLHLFIVERD